MPSRTWFILGREPLLSYAEIKTLTNCQGEFYAAPLLKVPGLVEPERLMGRLGGTIKIGRELAENLTKRELESAIIDGLKTIPGKKIFGLSWYKTGSLGPTPSPQDVGNFGKTIKRLLQEEDLSVRYIPNKDLTLSSVTVEKNGLVRRGKEFLIHDDGSGHYHLAESIAVQPFEAFGARDFGRPGRDDVSGMLPPKLALMMLNMSRVRPENTLLDPFCGSGTILTEALLQHYPHLVGSDNSEKAIADTVKNFAWTKERLTNKNPQEQAELSTFVLDAAKLDERIPAASIDTIVTEPYLGKPLRGTESKEGLLKQAQELSSLYRSALAALAKVLKPGGCIIMIIPRFRYRNEWITVPLPQELSFGLTIDPLLEKYPSLLYARPTQRVGREIWRMVKN
jgi:SAM-dependent methyltransferase